MEKSGIEKLGDDNYAGWAFDMKNQLVWHDLWSVVETEPVAPAADDEAAVAAFALARAKSTKALALMGRYVQNQHRHTLQDSATAKAAWDSLKAKHAASSAARQMALKDELHRISKREAASAGQSVARALDLRSALAAAGNDVDERNVV